MASRVDKNVMFAPITSVEECKEYIKDLLSYFRTKKIEDPYFPFTEEALEEIIQSKIEKGWIPRDLNKVMASLLEWGFFFQKSTIDIKFVNEMRNKIL